VRREDVTTVLAGTRTPGQDGFDPGVERGRRDKMCEGAGEESSVQRQRGRQSNEHTKHFIQQ